jgi:hypothetical protein
MRKTRRERKAIPPSTPPTIATVLVVLVVLDGALPTPELVVDNLFHVMSASCTTDGKFYIPDTSEYHCSIGIRRTLHGQLETVLAVCEVCSSI